MKGTTNALVLQGGDGGETVFAVNNTGTAIVRGTKAWLNRHNLDENTAYQHYAGGSSTQYAPVFDADNNFWVVNLSGTGRKLFTYDAETKAWTASDLNAGPSGRNFVRFIGGECNGALFFGGYERRIHELCRPVSGERKRAEVGRGRELYAGEFARRISVNGV